MITKANGKFLYKGAELTNADGTPCKNDSQAMTALAAKLEAAEQAAGTGRKAPTGLETKLDGSKLTIVLDLAANHGTTEGTVDRKTGARKGGGNVRIATTHGNIPISFKRDDGREVFVSVNAYGK